MRILMFGWEFPPHISGGLGTACFGLTRSLNSLGHHIQFVLPTSKVSTDSKFNSPVQLLNASEIGFEEKETVLSKDEKISFTTAKEDYYEKSTIVHELFEYIQINSTLTPYETRKDYLKKLKKFNESIFHTKERLIKKQVTTPAEYKVITRKRAPYSFKGGYGEHLLDEVTRYSLVAHELGLKKDFEVIHAHDWMTYPAGIEARRASKKPLIIHVHATEFDRSGHHVDPMIYSIERHGMHESDMIIAVSNKTKNTLMEHYGIPDKKIHVVHNAVIQDDVKSSSFKKSFKEKIVLFLGRITMQKGPGYFLEAARLVLDQIDNVRFVMAGNGDMFSDMVKTSAALGMQSHFHFTGFLKGQELNDIFNSCDLCVMPSVSEPFGIVPIEAMRHGLPVIVSKQSGVAEVLPNAIKVDFWDTHLLADKIVDVLSDEEKYQHIIKQNTKDLKSIQWDHAAEKVVSVYKEML